MWPLFLFVVDTHEYWTSGVFFLCVVFLIHIRLIFCASVKENLDAIKVTRSIGHSVGNVCGVFFLSEAKDMSSIVS